MLYNVFLFGVYNMLNSLGEYWKILALWICGPTMIYVISTKDWLAATGWIAATFILVLVLSQEMNAYYNKPKPVQSEGA